MSATRLKSTTSAEKTKVMAMITGVSLARMELMRSDPIPGTRKICSGMRAPAKIVGTCGAGPDEEGSDPGHAEDLLGDEGARKDRRHLQGDEGHHRDEGVPDDVLDD